jgi:hypothetical protein
LSVKVCEPDGTSIAGSGVTPRLLPPKKISAYGVTRKVRHRKEEPKPQPDDVTLARKVETEIFRSADVPKGKINVNAVDGVVELRGEADRPEMIRDLEDQVRNIPGVRDVRNMLHLPETPAPTTPEQASS